MNDNLLDDGLIAVMGANRVHDLTKSPVSRKAPVSRPETDDSPTFTSEERDAISRLATCAKTVCFFGALSLLVFYWQSAGLMASEIAIPCELVFVATAGFSIGRHFSRA